ncbi:Ubiquitin-conjugating enzyme family protein [Zea mays]|uniref:Auxin-responsive protein n=1 Tax=Zea mays TaxID=4577 RepID=A0A1D6NML1_MAIZE|nr:Ubiquitin-conjugating enzyme family protein [Zea mays]
MADLHFSLGRRCPPLVRARAGELAPWPRLLASRLGYEDTTLALTLRLPGSDSGRSSSLAAPSAAPSPKARVVGWPPVRSYRKNALADSSKANRAANFVKVVVSRRSSASAPPAPEIDPSESGIATTARCFQILLSPQDDDFDESAYVPVQLALIFAHTEKYPDEPPVLNVKSVRGIKPHDLASLKEKLQREATENLGMAMVYTLVSSAKEWLSEKYGQNGGDEEPEESEAEKEEELGSAVASGDIELPVVIIPHGEAVTVESFLAWRERFEAELALQRAKLMPDSALTATKEKKLTGRQYFESGRHAVKGASTVADEDEEEEEDIDFDDDFEGHMFDKT